MIVRRERTHSEKGGSALSNRAKRKVEKLTKRREHFDSLPADKQKSRKRPGSRKK